MKYILTNHTNFLTQQINSLQLHKIISTYLNNMISRYFTYSHTFNTLRHPNDLKADFARSFREIDHKLFHFIYKMSNKRMKKLHSFCQKPNNQNSTLNKTHLTESYASSPLLMQFAALSGRCT